MSELDRLIASTREIMETDDGFVRIRSGDFVIVLNGRRYRAALIGEDVLGNRTAVVILQTGDARIMQFYDSEIVAIDTQAVDDASRFDRVLCGVV